MPLLAPKMSEMFVAQFFGSVGMVYSDFLRLLDGDGGDGAVWVGAVSFYV